jgi:hypothetical protein
MKTEPRPPIYTRRSERVPRSSRRSRPGGVRLAHTIASSRSAFVRPSFLGRLSHGDHGDHLTAGERPLVGDPASPGGHGLGLAAVEPDPVQLPAGHEEQRRRVRRSPRDAVAPQRRLASREVSLHTRHGALHDQLRRQVGCAFTHATRSSIIGGTCTSGRSRCGRRRLSCDEGSTRNEGACPPDQPMPMRWATIAQ